MELQFSSETYSTIGQVILFSYNSLQIMLEMSVVAIVIVIKLVDLDQEVDFWAMTAHYCFFLSVVNQCIFFCVACAFATVTRDASQRKPFKNPSFFRQLATLPFPIITWLCTRYKDSRNLGTRFPITILIQSILTLLSPITYFYNLKSRGK